MNASKSHKLMVNILVTILIALCLFCTFYDVLCIYYVSMQATPHIDITSYPENIDYGILSEKQIETFDSILEAVENGESVISCPAYSVQERHEIMTQVGLYLGDMLQLGSLVSWNNNSAKLNLSLFDELLANKVIIDARVDEAVSTLREGSDKYKLWQISNYIVIKIEYTKEYYDVISGLNGKGVCSAYSMLFYKMATRLGIKNYICYGYVLNGDYHSWNMVELNGEYMYYDLTKYDGGGTVHNIEFIHRKSSWIADFQINNRWWEKNKK